MFLSVLVGRLWTVQQVTCRTVALYQLVYALTTSSSTPRLRQHNERPYSMSREFEHQLYDVTGGREEEMETLNGLMFLKYGSSELPAHQYISGLLNA